VAAKIARDIGLTAEELLQRGWWRPTCWR